MKRSSTSRTNFNMFRVSLHYVIFRINLFRCHVLHFRKVFFLSNDHFLWLIVKNSSSVGREETFIFSKELHFSWTWQFGMPIWGRSIRYVQMTLTKFFAHTQTRTEGRRKIFFAAKFTSSSRREKVVNSNELYLPFSDLFIANLQLPQRILKEFGKTFFQSVDQGERWIFFAAFASKELPRQ